MALVYIYKKKAPKSAISKHCWDLNHRFDFNIAKIFYKPHSTGELDILESFSILKKLILASFFPIIWILHIFAQSLLKVFEFFLFVYWPLFDQLQFFIFLPNCYWLMGYNSSSIKIHQKYPFSLFYTDDDNWNVVKIDVLGYFPYLWN